MHRTTSVFIGPILKCDVTSWPVMSAETRCSINPKHEVAEGSKYCPVCGKKTVIKQVTDFEAEALSLYIVDGGELEDENWKERGVTIAPEDLEWLNENFGLIYFDGEKNQDVVGFIGGGGFFIDGDEDETEEHDMFFHLPSDEVIDRLKRLMHYSDVRGIIGTNVRVDW